MTKRPPSAEWDGRLRLALLLSALPALAACGSADANLTPAQEYWTGVGMSAQVVHEYRGILDDPALNRYVYLVGTSLANASTRAETYKGPYNSYRFTILDSDDVNAYSAPSGFVFITKGLLRKCESEDELAAVLAHEVSHVVLRHPENAAATAKRDSDIKRGVGGAGTIASGVGSLLGNKTVKQVGDKVQEEATTLGDMLNVMAKGYDRGWEYDADRSALDLLARLGYDPLALKRVLQKLGVRKEGFLTGWDKTHPPPQDRVAEIDKIVDQRQKEGKPLRGQVEPVRTQRFQAAMVNVK